MNEMKGFEWGAMLKAKTIIFYIALSYVCMRRIREHTVLPWFV